MIIGKTSEKWEVIFLIILSIAINIHFRLAILSLPQFDESAKQEVYGDIHKSLSKNISLLYPFAPLSTKREMLKSLFDEYLRQKGGEVKDEIIQRSAQMKDYYRDPKGWLYPRETDSYRWMRRIDNYLATGHFGTRILNNQEYDDLEFAPQGDKIEPLRLHYLLGAFFYKFLNFINNKLTLMDCLSLTPVLLTPILVISIFCFCGLLRLPYFYSFLASSVFCLSPFVLARTSFGWFDTDIYNLFMPLIIASTLAYSFKVGKSKKTPFLLLTGLLTGIHSSLWYVWWLFFYIFLGSLSLYKLLIIVYDKQRELLIKIKESLSDILLFACSSYVSVLFISGPDVANRLFWDPINCFSLRQGLSLENFWPSIISSVSEVARSDMKTVVSFVGGDFILYGGFAGMIFIMFLALYKRFLLDLKEKTLTISILFTWLAVASVLTYFGKRFILFLITPLSISLCASVYLLYDLLTKRRNLLAGLFKKANRAIYYIAWVCIFSAVVVLPLYNAYKFIYYPVVNKSWWNMLMYIKNNTPKDAIINADWSEGDWIMSIAKRGTIHDAHWQYTPIPYWFYRALLTDNEEEAFGILRMINSGRDQAFEELQRELKYDRYTTLEIINKLVLLKKEDGRLLLSNYIHNEDALNRILKLIYEVPRPIYLMINYFMIVNMDSISRTGNWDFKRYNLWFKFGELNKVDFIKYAKEKLGYPQKDAEEIYRSRLFTKEKDAQDWIAQKVYKFYTEYSEKDISGSDDKMFAFKNGLVVDIDRLKAYSTGSIATASGWLIPGRLIFISKDAVKENKIKEGDENYAVLLTQEDNRYRAAMFSSPLAETLFFKLYFMDGKGLKHFKLKHHASRKGAENIYLYKVE